MRHYRVGRYSVSMAFVSLPCAQGKSPFPENWKIGHGTSSPPNRLFAKPQNSCTPRMTLAQKASADKTAQLLAEETATDARQFMSPSFPETISGEWFGFECTFSASTGAPLCVEDRYVPDAYRDWGVEIKGFEALTSSMMDADTLRIKRTRVLPSVGCEADAVVPEAKEFMTSAFGSTAENVGFENGNYCCGPVIISDDVAAKWGFCLVDPDAEPDKPRTRVRVDCGDVLAGRGVIAVHIEVWDAPFCDGVVLPGCGGTATSFADAPTLNPRTELVGTWAVSGSAFERTGSAWNRREVNTTVVRRVDDAEECVSIALPKGISLNAKTADSGAVVEVGWISAPGVRTVVNRTYDELGSISSINWHVERRQEALEVQFR